MRNKSSTLCRQQSVETEDLDGQPLWRPCIFIYLKRLQLSSEVGPRRTPRRNTATKLFVVAIECAAIYAHGIERSWATWYVPPMPSLQLKRWYLVDEIRIGRMVWRCVSSEHGTGNERQDAYAREEAVVQSLDVGMQPVVRTESVIGKNPRLFVPLGTLVELLDAS